MDTAIFYGVMKSLHIIFVVTWFAGLFYIFRLFIYQTEAALKGEPDRSILLDQFKIMCRRLWYIITWPSAIIATICGLVMLGLRPSLLVAPFMQLKLFFVLLLWLYQLFGHRVFLNLQNGRHPWSSFQLRLLNEVPTLILIAVVFLVIQRDLLSWIWGAVGIITIAGLLTFISKKYRDRRLRTERDENDTTESS